MKMIPLFKCRDMNAAIAFYTGVLDFKLKYPEDLDNGGVVDLVHGDMELQLTLHESNTLFGSVVNIITDEVDELFKKYLDRGLVVPASGNSPVHLGPVNQTWGRREFYITDADGNTLRFGKPFDLPRAVYKNASPYVAGNQMNLPVNNVNAAIAFYTGVMNFRVVSHEEKSVILERDAVQIALKENGGDPTQEGCFFEVDSIDTALRELQLNGLKKDASEIGIEKHGNIDWKIFYLLAPDGLCYCIGEQQL